MNEQAADHLAAQSVATPIDAANLWKEVLSK